MKVTPRWRSGALVPCRQGGWQRGFRDCLKAPGRGGWELGKNGAAKANLCCTANPEEGCHIFMGDQGIKNGRRGDRTCKRTGVFSRQHLHADRDMEIEVNSLHTHKRFRRLNCAKRRIILGHCENFFRSVSGNGSDHGCLRCVGARVLVVRVRMCLCAHVRWHASESKEKSKAKEGIHSFAVRRTSSYRSGLWGGLMREREGGEVRTPTSQSPHVPIRAPVRAMSSPPSSLIPPHVQNLST